MARLSVTVLALVACLSVLLPMVGLTGCARDRHQLSTGHRVGTNRTAEPGCPQIAGQRIDEKLGAKPGYNQTTDQGIEDSRTAERVREALAAGSDYKYDGVKVIACDGVVELSGFVNTSAQRNSAEEVASKAVGVKSVENRLTVKD
jgi:osmotically-inducible protein OsmY